MNKSAYDEERLAEWRERKAMKSEDKQLRTKFLAESTEETRVQLETEARETREHEINEKWKLKMVEGEIEKQQLIE